MSPWFDDDNKNYFKQIAIFQYNILSTLISSDHNMLVELLVVTSYIYLILM